MDFQQKSYEVYQLCVLALVEVTRLKEDCLPVSVGLPLQIPMIQPFCVRLGVVLRLVCVVLYHLASNQSTVSLGSL